MIHTMYIYNLVNLAQYWREFSLVTTSSLQGLNFALNGPFLIKTLPGQPPETLTTENGCFQRSVVASAPPPPTFPFTCADKDLCS